MKEGGREGRAEGRKLVAPLLQAATRAGRPAHSGSRVALADVGAGSPGPSSPTAGPATLPALRTCGGCAGNRHHAAGTFKTHSSKRKPRSVPAARACHFWTC